MNKKDGLIRKLKFIWVLQGVVLVSVVLYGVWRCRKKYADDCFGEKS